MYSQEEIKWAKNVLEKQNGFFFKLFNKDDIDKAKRILLWKNEQDRIAKLKEDEERQKRRDEEYRLNNERSYQNSQCSDGVQIEDVILAAMLIPDASTSSASYGPPSQYEPSYSSPSSSTSYSSSSGYSSYDSGSSSSSYDSGSSCSSCSSGSCD